MVNLFFETRSDVAQTGLELAIESWLTLNLWSSHLHFLCTVITGLLSGSVSFSLKPSRIVKRVKITLGNTY